MEYPQWWDSLYGLYMDMKYGLYIYMKPRIDSWDAHPSGVPWSFMDHIDHIKIGKGRVVLQVCQDFEAKSNQRCSVRKPENKLKLAKLHEKSSMVTWLWGMVVRLLYSRCYRSHKYVVYSTYMFAEISLDMFPKTWENSHSFHNGGCHDLNPPIGWL